jgi:membrane protease YdiL (CAAX protease family)
MASKIGGYFKETRQPIYSAALILPFLLIYHVGTLFLRTTYINGADALIIRILSFFSVHSMLASGLVLGISFVIWQLRTHSTWKINFGMLLVYFLESVCFALFLMFAFNWLSTHFSLAIGERKGSIANLVLYCGAGVYEELVFRGFLLGILIVACKRIFRNRIFAISSAAVLGALAFSVFHYVGPAGDSFSLASFLQRTIAGLYFSVLIVTRGFGVTAASHALYDIFIGMLAA